MDAPRPPLAALRDVMKREGLSAYVIPTEDAHGVRVVLAAGAGVVMVP